MEKNKSFAVSTIIFSILAMAVLILAILTILIYGFDSKNKLVQKVEKVIPFPAIVLNQTEWVMAGEFNENIRSIRQFYENQDFSKLGIRVDFDTADGQKRLRIKERQILTKMVEDRAIEILAQKEGIKINESDLTKSVDQKLEKMGNGAAVKEQLTRLYGWTIADFKEKVVRPSLYREKLENVFEEKYQNSKTSKDKIEAAENELNGRVKNFSEVVTEFSDGSSNQAAGELGWFRKDQIVPEIADQIFALKKGERSAVLESPLGFHIVEMEERKMSGKDELARIRQIFVSKKTFADWIDEELEKMKISVPLKGYVWNAEKKQVDFVSKELSDFEEKLKADPNGDISVMF